MPRLRNTEENNFLKSFCLVHYYYDGSGNLYYNKNTPYTLHPRNKKYVERPLPLISQKMTTSTGNTYEYLTETIRFKNKRYKILRSRLVWLLVYGEWPTGNVLHIDGNTKNCYHGNLVEVNPRMMHQYARVVRGLDKNIIIQNITTKCKNAQHTNWQHEISCPYVTENNGIREYGFKSIGLKKHSAKKELVERVYNGHMDYIVCTIHDKLNGINLEHYHVNKTRHQKIMREYNRRFK